MVTAISVGHGKAAVFEHHAHPGDAAAAFFVHGAGPGGDPADDGHPVRNAFAHQIDCRARPCQPAQRIAGNCIIERPARRGIGTHGHGIGHPRQSPARQITQRDREVAAIGRDRHRSRRALTIDANRIRPQSQPLGRRIGQRYRAFDPRRIGVADGQGVENDITRRSVDARRGLGQREIKARPVDRDIDFERDRIVEHEGIAE